MSTAINEAVVRKSWSIPEFAARHGIGQTSVYAEIKAGRLQARKMGARTIITREAEDAWLSALPVREAEQSAA